MRRQQNRRRSISSSRERSRERERQRRRRQVECIRRAGGFQKLADSEGRKPVRLFWDGFQWVAKTAAATASAVGDPASMNNTRKLRRLYVGNLPLHLGLTESLFQDLLWLEMKKRGLCLNPNEQPVLCVWFAKDRGSYGFIEFATVEETNRALQHLDGMLCMGVALRISRPNDYVGAAGSNTANATAQQQQALPPPPLSPVVYFRAMLQESDLEPEDTWETMLEDVLDGCKAENRTIVSSAIIDPEKAEKCPYDVGDVFVQFQTAEEASQCIQTMTGRRYLGRPVNPVPFELSAYEQFVKPLFDLKRDQEDAAAGALAAAGAAAAAALLQQPAIKE